MCYFPTYVLVQRNEHWMNLNAVFHVYVKLKGKSSIWRQWAHAFCCLGARCVSMFSWQRFFFLRWIKGGAHALREICVALSFFVVSYFLRCFFAEGPSCDFGAHAARLWCPFVFVLPRVKFVCSSAALGFQCVCIKHVLNYFFVHWMDVLVFEKPSVFFGIVDP